MKTRYDFEKAIEELLDEIEALPIIIESEEGT